MVDIARHQVAFFNDRLDRAVKAKEDLSDIIPDLEKMEMVTFDDDEPVEGKGQDIVINVAEKEGQEEGEKGASTQSDVSMA
ncbi:hypothetical protein NP233_g12143 [Leucocoprinus birnbaumii]|uniref:Uncharacterized protein n=1 Tax=Leucocoprinus birnbaumii TaxID=56174 RepID=A0AAD5VF80_9AGAR|nr:hypothetical protein NP233_g12143 [Leucocoprinus birnbaumii]